MGVRDLEIARAVKLRPIQEIGQGLGLTPEELEPYGHFKAKVGFPAIARLADRPDGKLVLVTAMTPTPAGEGKSTTTVGLADGFRRIGRRSIVALREPSLGPVFGVKGGAAGGGRAQIAPMEDINLHFTGDMHAIGAAHGVPREGGFEITVASEVMAILCLARDLSDFKARVERIVVGETHAGALVEARQLKAAGAMAVLMKDAIKPNLVQTLEGTPAFVHGGPFGNIAHGCNSLIATRLALKLGEVVVTEAGFASDLGAEKFVDIKARTGGLRPSAAVIVATVRALKLHGGVAQADLGREDVGAVRRGTENLAKHVENVRSFGLTPVVALNHFTGDAEAEVAAVLDTCRGWGAAAAVARGWELGGAGMTELAEAVSAAMASADPKAFNQLYPDDWGFVRKIETVVTRMYGADGVQIAPAAATKLARWESLGYGKLPICMAKTQNSLSDDTKKLGRPRGFTVTVRDAKLAAGAGFVVVYAGDILTMPGLPKVPGAESMDVDAAGNVVGLF
jgi:formate--tetrahydrofolate ligase